MAPRQELAERNQAVSALGVIAPPPIHVTTPTFDGSLGTLFRCVREHKVQLLEVPLFPICEAYFIYLLKAELRDLDEAAAALAALSYLLERKAWALLPVPEPEPDLEEAMELPEPSTHEYDMAIDVLKVWHEERSQQFFRSPEVGPDPYELPYTLGNVSPEDLARAFQKLLRRAQPEEVRPLGKPRKSLSDQMVIVLKAMTNDFQTLDQLITDPFTKSEAVYWFLALLELVRLGQVAVRLTEADVEFARARHGGSKVQSPKSNVEGH
jgi:segregation and condensation protein A